ncbi:MAG: hypothetical protein PHS04_09000 [Tissierellia bacterium]|jgi:hypothetical protein|nr:hypothetical protein [Tissierellia bacterium]
MNAKILLNANEDIPLYLDDFKTFWQQTIGNCSDDVLTDIYHSTLIFRNWKFGLFEITGNNVIEILNELHEDVNSSFYQTLFGLYRSAHMHLRSCIELSMQYLYFLEHPVEYTLWQNGDFVIKHDRITEYLKQHPRIKSQELDDVINNITKHWKMLSKHIHGEAPIYFQSEKESRKTNSFRAQDFGVWKSNFMKTTYYVNKLMLMYFKNDLVRIPVQNKTVLLRNIKDADYAILGILKD